MPTCPVLLDLFVAWLPRVRSDPNNLFFRCRVLTCLSGLFIINLSLTLFIGHIVVVVGSSRDVHTAHPITVCGARGVTCVLFGSYGSRAVGRARLRYAP